MRYAIIGAGGYIARKHREAIESTGGHVALAHDVAGGAWEEAFRAAGARVTRDPAAFWECVSPETTDCVVICTPSDCHTRHIFLALDRGVRVICEKPLTLGSWECAAVRARADDAGLRVDTILQWRQAPAVLDFVQFMRAQGPRECTIRIQYRSTRPTSYERSWKAQPRASGGVLISLGVHIWDMLTWGLGLPGRTASASLTAPLRWNHAEGSVAWDSVHVEWLFCVCSEHLGYSEHGAYTDRRIDVSFGDGTAREWMLSEMPPDLHARAYTSILNHKGASLAEVSEGLHLVECIASGEALRDPLTPDL